MIQECEYRGAKITLIKDDTTEMRRHVWANINGKAHPYYKQNDYNKSIWRKNTPENRVKMRIINNFLNK